MTFENLKVLIDTLQMLHHLHVFLKKIQLYKPVCVFQIKIKNGTRQAEKISNSFAKLCAIIKLWTFYAYLHKFEFVDKLYKL